MARSGKATLARKDDNIEESLTIHNQEIDTPVLPIEQMKTLHDFRPDVVDWILKQTEDEANFRRTRNVKNDHNIHRERLIGQVFGLVIGLSGVIGGACVAIYGHPGAGGTIATVSIGTLAVAFLKAQKR
ncbi:MAG: hypothetical protein LBM70_03910 [Victivallales bacterium]|jgi:uncharacterized membrane protein|nr:hypothetical protein [Victivallales bacterium]